MAIGVVAVLWQLPTWLWLVVGSVGLVASGLIVRALTKVFRALGELVESVEVSKRVLTASLETARDEAERAQAGLTRLRAREQRDGPAAPEQRLEGRRAGQQPYEDW